MAVTIGTATSKIVAAGLEDPVRVTNATTLIYRSPGPTNVLTVDSPSPGINRVSGTSGGAAVLPLTFWNVPTVTVDTKTNDGTPSRDTVTLAASGFQATGLRSFTSTPASIPTSSRSRPPT